MSAEGLTRLETLMTKLESVRGELDAADDPDRVVEVLSELSELAKEIQAEIETVRREGPAA